MTLAQSPGRIHDAKQKLEQERTHFEVLIRISAYEALLDEKCNQTGASASCCRWQRRHLSGMCSTPARV